MTEGMSAFARRYNVSLNDPDLRRMYDLEMSAKRDQASALDNAERKGTATAYYTVVRRALSQNLPMDVIYALVDAPRSEVDAIIAKVRAEGKQ